MISVILIYLIRQSQQVQVENQQLRAENLFLIPVKGDKLLPVSVDIALFFRINRQYLISRKAVQDIDLWFNGRLAINLIVPTLERILVSKARVPDFKTWFTS